MKLINVTNNHSQLVMSQLENTDSHLVEVYSMGNTSMVYTEAPTHNEVVLLNKNRNINDMELEAAQKFYTKRLRGVEYSDEDVETIRLDGLVEISIPHERVRSQFA